eukprot:sb/3478714/
MNALMNIFFPCPGGCLRHPPGCLSALQKGIAGLGFENEFCFTGSHISTQLEAGVAHARSYVGYVGREIQHYGYIMQIILVKVTVYHCFFRCLPMPILKP